MQNEQKPEYANFQHSFYYFFKVENDLSITNILRENIQVDKCFFFKQETEWMDVLKIFRYYTVKIEFLSLETTVEMKYNLYERLAR